MNAGESTDIRPRERGRKKGLTRYMKVIPKYL